MDLRDLLCLLKEDADVCLKENDLKLTLGEADKDFDVFDLVAKYGLRIVNEKYLEYKREK